MWLYQNVLRYPYGWLNWSVGTINAYKYFTSCEIDFHHFICTYIEDTIKIYFRWSLFG